jgi:YfiH family protein
MGQVHGNRVAVIDENSDDIEGVDALVTTVPGITLGVLVADCIPLLIRSQSAVAAVHVGRKGLLNGLTDRVLDVMDQLGSTSYTATIGPYICGRCYEVSPEIAAMVSSKFPQASSETARATPALDIGAGLRSILIARNIAIDDQSRCTVESIDLFSYRGDGVTGRQAGLISL